MMLGFGIIGTQLHAEIILLNNLSVKSIQRVLSTKYGTTIDADGDLKLTAGNSTIWIKITTTNNKKILHVFSLYNRYEKRTMSEMITLANQWNYENRLLRVAIDPKDGSITCDCYMIYVKGLDSDNLLETVKFFAGLTDCWKDFVINGGDK